MSKSFYGCLRIFVMIINILFLLIGLLILALALLFYFEPTITGIKNSSNVQATFDIALFVMMAVGGLTVIISLFGCCGAIHESACLLGFYLVCIFIIAAAEVSAGVFLYYNRASDQVRQGLDKSISMSISNVTQDSMPQHMTYLQQTLRCCGSNGSGDYYNATVASAVCRSNDGERFREGCTNKIMALMDAQSLWILIIVACVAVFEIITMLISIYLCCSVRNHSNEYVGVNAGP